MPTYIAAVASISTCAVGTRPAASSLWKCGGTTTTVS